jgi:hypothetical protein
MMQTFCSFYVLLLWLCPVHNTACIDSQELATTELRGMMLDGSLKLGMASAHVHQDMTPGICLTSPHYV